MEKKVDIFWKKFEEKREKGEFEEEHKNWLLKVLTNRSFFVLHLFAYCSVNGFLIMIFLLSLRFTGLTYFWPFNTLFGWGFGMGFHALSYIIYNDKSEYLTYLRQQSRYIVAFIYHAFFYISVNLFLFLLNLIDLTFIWFTWSLGMWGILFVYHAIGFFTWNEIFKIQWKKLRPKYQEYSKNRLKTKIKYKIGNFWLLLIHLTYFIVTFIIVEIYVFIGSGLGGIEQLLVMEIFLSWGIILGWHAFAYILYYYVPIIKSVVKGLILHISLFATRLLDTYFDPEPFTIWHLYFILLWFIAILIHAGITLKWSTFVEKEQAKVRKKFDGSDTKRIERFWTAFSREKVPIKEIPREDLTQEITSYLEEDVRLIAKSRLFWRWTLITHVIIYVTGLIIIGINFSIQGTNLILLIHPIFGWLIGVAAHSALYYIVQKPIKGFWDSTAFLHTVVFIIVNVYLVVINLIFAPSIIWFLYPLIGWGIGLGIHILITYAGKREKKKEREIKKTKGVLFWQWSLIIHLFIYLMVLGIISITIITNRESFSGLFHTAMGWGIGIAIHGAIFYVVLKPIKRFWDYTAFIHLITYITVSVYLVLLNIIYTPTVIWSPIAIGGWGIGIGFHIILAHLTKK